MLVCLCVRVCVWCAVAGLLDERSTFVFDFSFRSARFDVQECSSRGKARQEPRYRVSSTCVPQMYYTYVAKQGEHCSQNKLLLQCSHFSAQLISSASSNPHRTLLSRSPCECVYVCAYLALYKHLSHRPKNNTAIQQQQQQPQNAKLHCKVVAAVAVCCLRSLIASNCRLSAASTLLTYIHTYKQTRTHTRTRIAHAFASAPLNFAAPERTLAPCFFLSFTVGFSFYALYGIN